MSFFLKDLESALPEDIVRKGLDYYASERVDNLAVQDDKWQADVYGTDTYTVTITMQGEEVLNWFCDCPYDWGPVCKHVAAVLITIRSERAEVELEKMRAGYSLQQGGRKTPESPNPVEQIISGLKKGELREALKYLAIRENEVRAYLLTKYADRVETSSKQEFVSVVQTLIKAHYSGSDGYLDYRKLLSSDYRELYIKLYDKGVRHKMEHSSDRQKYRECCNYLKVLLELGAQDNVRQIIADWEETYPRRRAMLEEIKRIRL